MLKRFKNLHFTAVAIIILLAVTTTALSVKAAFAISSEDWTAFQNGGDNNAVTDVCLPLSADDASLRWAVNPGDKVSPALVIGTSVYVASGRNVYKINRFTGEIEKTNTEPMVDSAEHALFPMTYGDGKFFVTVNGGRVQAIDAETLEPLWCTERLGGQSISPVTYSVVNGKGMIFTGTYNNKGCYFGAMTDNSNVNNGIKKVSWTFSPADDDSDLSPYSSSILGFYWAGAVVREGHIFFGSEAVTVNGSEVSRFYSLDAATGKMVSKITDVPGSIRSTPVYYSGKLYFASTGGKLYKTNLSDSGSLGTYSVCDMGGSMTTTPVIYNDRLYVGVNGSGITSAHYSVVGISGGGAPSEVYRVNTPYYSQGSPVVSAFDDGSGTVRVYLTYNYKPGGIYLFSDKPGKTSAALETLFEPADNDMQEFCISQLAVDDEGTIYYVNDSNNVMAVGSSIGPSEMAKYDASLSILKLSRTNDLSADNENILTSGYDKEIKRYNTDILPKDGTNYYLWVKSKADGASVTVHGSTNVAPDLMYTDDIIDDSGSHKTDGSTLYTIAPSDPMKNTVVKVKVVSPNGKVTNEYDITIVRTDEDQEDGDKPAPIKPKVVKGKSYKVSGQTYKVTQVAKGLSAGAVTLVKAKNARSVSIPAAIKLADRKSYKVTQSGAKAFTGKKIRVVTVGKNVKKLAKFAFKSSRATKLILKTKLLKKASVKGSLKGSKVKTVRVNVGNKSKNKSFVKKYKRIFTKTNAGRKVKIK